MFEERHPPFEVGDTARVKQSGSTGRVVQLTSSWVVVQLPEGRGFFSSVELELVEKAATPDSYIVVIKADTEQQARDFAREHGFELTDGEWHYSAPTTGPEARLLEWRNETPHHSPPQPGTLLRYMRVWREKS